MALPFNEYVLVPHIDNASLSFGDENESIQTVKWHLLVMVSFKLQLIESNLQIPFINFDSKNFLS